MEGSLAANQANAVSNLVGKFVQTVQLDMKYHALRESMPNMPFLNSAQETKKIEHDKETGEIKEE
jgi:hypothetical protein